MRVLSLTVSGQRLFDQLPQNLDLSKQATPSRKRSAPVPVSNDTYSGKFYCVKCKDHREAEGAVSVNEKGTRIAKAKCPECGTNLTRFLPKA